MAETALGGRSPMPRHALVVAVFAVLVQALLVTLFAWPAVNTAPRDLPIIIAGPAAAATRLADTLADQRPGAFTTTLVSSETEADEMLRDHEAYAAFIVGADGLSLHLASAASPVVAQLLTPVAQELGQGGRVAVVDVVPTTEDDPRGVGFAAGFLPVVLTSLLVGALLMFVVRGRLGRLVGVVTFSVLAALVGTGVLQYGMDALSGNYLANAGVIGLLALAMAGTVLGLSTLLGPAGLGIGGLLMLAVGNPFSGVSSAPELLPQPWGQLGQLLPPGAGSTLLREVSYFDGAGAAGPAVTLVCWATAGLVMIMLGNHRGTGHQAQTGQASVADGTGPAEGSIV
ncbi:MAG: hypothetical protein HKP61_19070 [Dactylosporangium sp.]|nr:hypothetical protein [Dactylosporangium sp.]NNJ62991.1 hypothetical protein [Dactylosporangium sp.]